MRLRVVLEQEESREPPVWAKGSIYVIKDFGWFRKLA